VIYVGTGDPEKTGNAAHRRRLLSVISVEPRAPISTRDIVPPKSWEHAVERWGAGGNGLFQLRRLITLSTFPKLDC
jgi:hypothetical protein